MTSEEFLRTFNPSITSANFDPRQKTVVNPTPVLSTPTAPRVNTAPAPAPKPAASTRQLTPEIAKDLYNRSMITGVNTGVLNSYGGMDAVKQMALAAGANIGRPSTEAILRYGQNAKNASYGPNSQVNDPLLNAAGFRNYYDAAQSGMFDGLSNLRGQLGGIDSIIGKTPEEIRELLTAQGLSMPTPSPVASPAQLSPQRGGATQPLQPAQMSQANNVGSTQSSFLSGGSTSGTAPQISSGSTGGSIPNGFVSNVDPQIKQAFLENYEFAKGVANQPYQAYTGPRVAQFSADQQLLFDKAREMANQPQSFLAGNISQYMNPYQDEVINRFQTDLERQRQLADQNVNANAVSRGAFGGSRQAVAQSENTRNFMDTSARNLANLRAQGFDTAAQLMQSDINRANQGLNFLGQTGALQQGQVQRNYDTAYQDFLQQRDYPLKQLQIRGMGLGQSLPNFGIQQTPPTPQTNTAGNALGGALIGSQIGAGFGGGFLGGNTGQILGALGGGLLGGFL